MEEHHPWEGKLDSIETGLMELGAKVEWLTCYIQHLEAAINAVSSDEETTVKILNTARRFTDEVTGGMLSSRMYDDGSS